MHIENPNHGGVMENDIRPIENFCPKCSGFYLWTEGTGHCLCCGYMWNPQINRQLFTSPHCAFKCCLAPIPKYERIYCPKHEGEIVDAQAMRNIDRQKRYVRKVGGMQDDGQIRLNAPIMVKLKAQHRKTVA